MRDTMCMGWGCNNGICGICYTAVSLSPERKAYQDTSEYKSWREAFQDFLNSPQDVELHNISKELMKILHETPEYKAYKKFKDEYHEMMRQKEGREKYKYE